MQHMRSENPSLVGRDHLAYRGYYAPVNKVVDGDVSYLLALLICSFARPTPRCRMPASRRLLATWIATSERC